MKCGRHTGMLGGLENRPSSVTAQSVSRSGATGTFRLSVLLRGLQAGSSLFS